MRFRILLFSSLLCLGPGGCRRETGGPIVVTDSAGIRITLNEDAPKTFAAVDSQPVLSLGGSDAKGPAEFYRIQNILMDSNQRLWVADGQSGEIRLFLPDGTHWKTLGGRGEGPGEFQDIRMLGLFHGDSIAVWDNSLGRITILDESGNLARVQQVVAGETPPIRCTQVFLDGSLLGQVPRILSAGSIEPGQLLGDSVHIVRLTPEDPTPRPWANSLGPRWLWTGRNQVPIPFTINAAFDLLGEELHLVSGTDFRIRVFEGGLETRIYGIARKRREVTDADIEAYRSFVREYVPEQRRADYLSPLGHPELPTHLPAYSRLLVTSSDLVWAQTYSPDFSGPATWDVFDRLGEWLGAVETPPGLSAMTVGSDRIGGVWRDDLGVEHVRVYQIISDQGAG